MTLRTDEAPQSLGHSGDLGWGDSELPMNGCRSVLLLVATSAYFGSAWLLSGLAPLPFVASRLVGGRGNRLDFIRRRTSTSLTGG